MELPVQDVVARHLTNQGNPMDLSALFALPSPAQFADLIVGDGEVIET